MTTHPVTTVALVDDHPLVRQGLRAVLEAADDIRVVAEASDGHQAIKVIAQHQPNVVIMDLQMPGLHGLDATREILTAHPGIAVLVLTMFEDDDMVFSAMAAGAVGYLLKGANGTDILTAVRAADAGQAVFGAALARRLQTWFTRAPRPAAPFPELTTREREILDAVAAGLTNPQIGQRMFLSAKTVANNVSTILAKLHLAERSQAIVLARDAGLGRNTPTTTSDHPQPATARPRPELATLARPHAERRTSHLARPAASRAHDPRGVPEDPPSEMPGQGAR